jgi:hypothetical protein
MSRKMKIAKRKKKQCQDDLLVRLYHSPFDCLWRFSLR